MTTCFSSVQALNKNNCRENKSEFFLKYSDFEFGNSGNFDFLLGRTQCERGELGIFWCNSVVAISCHCFQAKTYC